MTKYVNAKQASDYLAERKLDLSHARITNDYEGREWIVKLLGVIHPEMSSAQEIAWVRRNVLRDKPTSPTEQTLSSGRLKFPAINSDFLPFYGKRRAMEPRIAAFNAQHKISLCDLAGHNAIGAPYITYWAKAVIARLENFVIDNHFVDVSYDSNGTYAERARQQLSNDNEPDKKELEQRITHLMAKDFVAAVFMRPVITKKGREDIMVSPMMEQLIDLNYIEKAHRYTIEDYGWLQWDEQQYRIQWEEDERKTGRHIMYEEPPYVSFGLRWSTWVDKVNEKALTDKFKSRRSEPPQK